MLCLDATPVSSLGLARAQAQSWLGWSRLSARALASARVPTRVSETHRGRASLPALRGQLMRSYPHSEPLLGLASPPSPAEPRRTPRSSRLERGPPSRRGYPPACRGPPRAARPSRRSFPCGAARGGCASPLRSHCEAPAHVSCPFGPRIVATMTIIFWPKGLQRSKVSTDTKMTVLLPRV